MQNTVPQAMRRHVVILGDTNAGKSTLFNALTGQDNAIVSSVAGTTTDPVVKSMELIPYGPIVLVDTAGLSDNSNLGEQRMRRTNSLRRRADAAVYAADAASFEPLNYQAFQKEGMPHILVFTKGDTISPAAGADLTQRYPGCFLWEEGDEAATEQVRQGLSSLLSELEPEPPAIIGDLVAPGGTVVLVIPIDSEAPKGRIILPQMQALRDCLDHGIVAVAVRDTELTQALESLHQVDLVVTDSQAFQEVSRVVPEETPLTSFSMLLARQRGNFPQLLEGVGAVENIPDGGTILLLEGCTHNSTHEDIGRVKIPAMLHKRTGKQFSYRVCSGYDFPDSLDGIDFAVQCGSCMLAGREISSREQLLSEHGIPVTNYGILLAWGAGILERSCEIFRKGGLL